MGWTCRTLQPFKPPAVLITLFPSLHLLPLLLALQLAVPYSCSQEGGNEASHIPSLTADTWGACPPTQRQLIKAVFLNLYCLPCSCQQIVPSIFMTSVFQTQELLEQHKSIFSLAHNYVKGASHRPKVDNKYASWNNSIHQWLRCEGERNKSR